MRVFCILLFIISILNVKAFVLVRDGMSWDTRLYNSYYNGNNQ